MSKSFKPGGRPGKLHHELGIPTDEPIPAGRLESAMHSSDREVRDDAIRAHTMENWHHTGPHHHGHHHGMATGVMPRHEKSSAYHGNKHHAAGAEVE